MTVLRRAGLLFLAGVAAGLLFIAGVFVLLAAIQAVT